jgi:hypothetical protein
MQGGCVVYILVFLAFIQFRTHFSNIAREFHSPLGIPGALLGIAIFTVVRVTILIIIILITLLPY